MRERERESERERERERGCNAVTQVEGDYNKEGLLSLSDQYVFAERDALRDFPKGARKKRKKKVAKKKDFKIQKFNVFSLLSLPFALSTLNNSITPYFPCPCFR